PALVERDDRGNGQLGGLCPGTVSQGGGFTAREYLAVVPAESLERQRLDQVQVAAGRTPGLAVWSRRAFGGEAAVPSTSPRSYPIPGVSACRPGPRSPVLAPRTLLPPPSPCLAPRPRVLAVGRRPPAGYGRAGRCLLRRRPAARPHPLPAGGRAAR